MSDESTIEKIKKLEGKKKSAGIIKLLDGKHSDAEVMCAGSPVKHRRRGFR